MNAWFVAASVMLVLLVPCGVVCLRGDPVKRLVGLEAGAVVVTLTLTLLAQAFDRDVYFDVALTFALLSFGGGLVFARVLERWL